MEQLPQKLPSDPLAYIERWLNDAREDGIIPNPDAMTLATTNAQGQPSARIVLCKQVVRDPGYLVFYTNYESVKAGDIEASGRVAGVFHWDHMDRQVRFEGIAVRSPAEESDAYFATRDKESQIGAWTSAQSRPISGRRVLMSKQIATTRRLADLAEETGRNAIPRPPSWGGYRIGLRAVEVWLRGAARLHDRARWERDLSVAGHSFTAGSWTSTRLQP